MTAERPIDPRNPTDAAGAHGGAANEASAGAQVAGADAAATMSPDYRPPERQQEWSQPYVKEPILDAARVPLEAFEAGEPSPRAYMLYIWLHALRPLLVGLFWIGVAIYAWRHFFRPTENMDDASLLALYLLGALGVFVLVLLLAPLRRLLRTEEESSQETARESTVFEVADYAEVTPGRLSAWSQARRLQVQHDDEGRLSHASDLDGRRRRRSDDIDEPVGQARRHAE